MAIAAFIGLGNMGYPMAGHLAAAGHEVRVFNRTSAKSEQWAGEHAGTACALRPPKQPEGADFVALCAWAPTPMSEQSVTATTVYSRPWPKVRCWLTTPRHLPNWLESSVKLAKRTSIGFVDAPISGGQAGAENGALSVMCGGVEADFDRALPLIDAYSSAVTLVGEVGSGQLTKMCNQILCAGAIQGAAEAIAFGQKAGLDMDKVLAAVTKGAAGSWYLSNRGTTMVNDEFDFGFAVDWMAKDLGLVQEEAGAMGASTPLTELVSGYLKATQDAGENRMDATAIVRRYRD